MSVFPDSVTVAARTALTGAGVPTYATGVASRASVQAARVIAYDTTGAQVRTAGARIFLPGALDVDNGDKITHGSTVYEVVGYEPFDDPGKPNYRLVYARLL